MLTQATSLMRLVKPNALSLADTAYEYWEGKLTRKFTVVLFIETVSGNSGNLFFYPEFYFKLVTLAHICRSDVYSIKTDSSPIFCCLIPFIRKLTFSCLSFYKFQTLRRKVSSCFHYLDWISSLYLTSNVFTSSAECHCWKFIYSSFSLEYLSCVKINSFQDIKRDLFTTIPVSYCYCYAFLSLKG